MDNINWAAALLATAHILTLEVDIYTPIGNKDNRLIVL